MIKIITGMRRVGKSFFLRQIIDLLGASGVSTENICYIDKELMEYDFIRNYEILYQYVERVFSGIEGQLYLFVDEVQEIEGWEKAINSFLKKGDIDIFITGSNAHLFSSELSTLISGRYIEFPVYTLSFKEFLNFRGDKKTEVINEFRNYIHYGGLPGLHHFDFSEEVVYPYIDSIYSTILLKDIIKRNNIRNVSLLESINKYIFDNFGNVISAKRISDFLKSQQLGVGVETVQNYIGYLLSTFAAYRVQRYDIKGKRLLELNEKYFVGDIGMRHAVLSYREKDISGILENIVFLELKRRGYQVYSGKFGEKEVDFIAEKDGNRLYIQVTYLLAAEETFNQEFGVLREIKDNYPKYVLSMDTLMENDFEGIKRLYIPDFLLNGVF